MKSINEIIINEIADLKYGKSLPDRERKGGPIPVYGSGGIGGYHDKAIVQKGIIIGRKGSVGTVRFSETPFYPIDTVFFVDEVKGENDLKFFYYFLQSIGLSNFDSDAAVPGLNRNLVHKLKAVIPEPKTQQRIAFILSAYDDLIEVNNQRIKLLEETARELYKEWFVRMRFPEYKKSKFKKGIPTDWRIEPIGKIIDYHIGGGWGNDNKDNQFSVAGYVIRGTDIPKVRAGQANQDVYRFHKASNMKSRELIEGDMVFETAGGSEGQPLGRTCYITQEMLDAYGDKVMAASFCKQIRTTSIPSLYLYYFLNYLYDTGMIEAYQVQSTGISNYQFEPFLKFQQIILPKDELMQSFHDKAILMQKQISILGQQNTQLRQIRDRLLPRLISGKLEVKELLTQSKEKV
jgi:type I restriction enzyme S subunit